MMGDDLTVIDGAAAGAWIRPRLGGEFGAVTLQVPNGFEAYARVLHPATDSEREPISWAAVADRLGSIAHREMQWHALIGSPDPDNFTGSRWPGGNPSLGAMGPATLDALSEVISAHTRDTPNCFFGLCTIQTWEEQFSAEELRQPYLELPDGRDHIVLAGPLSAARRIVRDWGKQTAAVFTFGNGAKVDPSEWRLREAPNLIWPADHSWLVASEVDFDSTLVGGSNELIEAIVGSPTLEAWQVEPADSLAADADKINRPGSRDG